MHNILPNKKTMLKSLWNVSSCFLGSQIFLDGSSNHEGSLIHMFHAGTPQSVKTHVVGEMRKTDSHLRILICTIAFGMGIAGRGFTVAYTLAHHGQ